VSSAAGTGSNNLVTDDDVLLDDGSHHHESGRLSQFIDEYGECVCIEEPYIIDGIQTADYASGYLVEPAADTGSSHSAVVGISPAELESFNENIRFDHMYYRQPSVQSIVVIEEPIIQSPVPSEDVVDDGSELASDDELNLSSFSESDLSKLTDCLDWLIGSASTNDDVSGLKCSLVAGSAHETCPTQLDDKTTYVASGETGSVQFVDDSFISTNPFDCSITEQASHVDASQLVVDNYGPTSCDRFEQTTIDLAKSENSFERNANDLIESLMTCASPTSSSGCESDFSGSSSSSYGDEYFSYSDDINFAALTDDSFTELFPELY